MTVYVYCFYHHSLLNFLVSWLHGRIELCRLRWFSGCFNCDLISWFFYTVFSSYFLSHLLVSHHNISWLSIFVNLSFSKVIVLSLFFPEVDVLSACRHLHDFCSVFGSLVRKSTGLLPTPYEIVSV